VEYKQSIVQRGGVQSTYSLPQTRVLNRQATAKTVIYNNNNNNNNNYYYYYYYYYYYLLQLNFHSVAVILTLGTNKNIRGLEL